MLTWKFHTGPVYDLAFTPDGRLLTCSSDRLIRLWDVATRTELRRWEFHGQVDQIAVSPDGRLFACCGGRGMSVWRIDGEGKAVLSGCGGWAQAFSPDGKRLVAVGSGRSPCAWSLPVWKPLAGVRPIDGYHLAFHPDGKTLAAAFLTEEDDGREVFSVRLVTVATGKDLAVLTPTKSKGGGPLAFSPDGRWLASIHAEAVVLWDVETRTEIVRRAPNRKEMKGLAFTADGQRLLTAGHDELARVWAAPNWDEVNSFDWKIGSLKCLTVNRVGTLAAAGGDRGKVVVWDLD
jgi:WD40 repeat protein